MLEKLLIFFAMGGYGGYVFSAYGAVLVFLIVQWFIPWRRWHAYLKKMQEQ